MSQVATTRSRDYGPISGAVVIALGLFAVSAAGATTASTTSLLFSLGACASLGGLLWVLIRAEAFPAAVLLVLLGFAYVPSAWDALAIGFPRTLFRVTPEGLHRALLTLLFQVLITVGAAVLAVRSRWLREKAASAVRVFEPQRRTELFLLSFAVLLLAALVGSIADGMWTSYMPGKSTFDESKLAGGFRLALFYSPWLLAMCAIIGVSLRDATSALQRQLWWGAAALVLALTFFLQGRRLIISGAAFIVLPQLTGVTGRGQSRRLLALAGAGLAVGALLYGSLVWREALRHRSEDTVSHLRGMAQTSVNARDTVENLRDRLTYLWIDSAAMEIGDRLSSGALLERSMIQGVVGNIPGSLFPDKYSYTVVTCETVLVNSNGDLPCTPLTEGMLVGGTLGFCLTSLAWVLAVFTASLLYASRARAGVVLGTAFLYPLTSIETSSFPILAGTRILIFTALALSPLVFMTLLIYTRGGFQRAAEEKARLELP